MNNDTPGNRLYDAIVKRLTPHYPAGARDLDWDVLPSTLATLAKERDAALAREADALATVAAHSREIMELRLTLAAEQGRAEGAPSEGWRRGRPPDYYGGLDVRWYREVTPLVHVVVAWTGTGWIWRHFGGAMWLPWHYRRDPEVPTARAAMIAADKATT